MVQDTIVLLLCPVPVSPDRYQQVPVRRRRRRRRTCRLSVGGHLAVPVPLAALSRCLGPEAALSCRLQLLVLAAARGPIDGGALATDRP